MFYTSSCPCIRPVDSSTFKVFDHGQNVGFPLAPLYINLFLVRPLSLTKTRPGPSARGSHFLTGVCNLQALALSLRHKEINRKVEERSAPRAHLAAPPPPALTTWPVG